MKLAAQPTTPLNPAAWLFRTVRNGAINAGIAKRRRRRHEAEAVAEGSRLVRDRRRRLGAGAVGRPRVGPGRAGRAAVGATRGHRGPPLGWADLRSDRRVGRFFRRFHSPIVPSGPDGPERTPGGAMSNEPVSPSPDPELNAIEAALGSLEPARSRIDRDTRDVPGRSGFGAPVAMGTAGLDRDRREPCADCARRGRIAGPSASTSDRQGGGCDSRAGDGSGPAPGRSAPRAQRGRGAGVAPERKFPLARADGLRAAGLAGAALRA